MCLEPSLPWQVDTQHGNIVADQATLYRSLKIWIVGIFCVKFSVEFLNWNSWIVGALICVNLIVGGRNNILGFKKNYFFNKIYKMI